MACGFRRNGWRALRAGKRLVRMTHGSLSPAWCLDHGGALRSLNGWRESKVRIVEEFGREMPIVR